MPASSEGACNFKERKSSWKDTTNGMFGLNRGETNFE